MATLSKKKKARKKEKKQALAELLIDIRRLMDEFGDIEQTVIRLMEIEEYKPMGGLVE